MKQLLINVLWDVGCQLVDWNILHCRSKYRVGKLPVAVFTTGEQVVNCRELEGSKCKIGSKWEIIWCSVATHRFTQSRSSWHLQPSFTIAQSRWISFGANCYVTIFFTQPNATVSLWITNIVSMQLTQLNTTYANQCTIIPTSLKLPCQRERQDGWKRFCN